jgi:hypothetical protein
MSFNKIILKTIVLLSITKAFAFNFPFYYFILPEFIVLPKLIYGGLHTNILLLTVLFPNQSHGLKPCFFPYIN